MTPLTEPQAILYRSLYNPKLLAKVDAERRRKARERRQREYERMKSRISAENAAAAREAARKLKAKQIAQAQKHRVPVRQIIELVARKHGLTVKQITGRALKRHVTTARHEAIAEIKRSRPEWSLNQVGKFFGYREHTVVLYALRKHGVPTS